MLSEQDFEIIEKQANSLYMGLELEIIQEIAERIANVSYANTVVKNDVKIAEECNILYDDIIKMVAKYNESNEADVLKIFQEAGIKALRKDDKIYKSAGLDPKGLSKSMQQLIGATAKRTHNNLSNLTLTTANTSQTTFLNAINKSYLEVSTGIKSYSQSIMDAIKDVANQGATIQYPSGRNINIESAVRMNIVTSVNQNSAKLQEMRAEELGWDLVEVSAHSGARPEHAEWQGKVYSLKGKTKGYKTLADGCGYGTVTGLCGVNCRHTFFPYYKGSIKTYTAKDLNKLKNEKVTYNGKKYSVYEASQMQRQLERNIRNTKKDIAGLQGILTSNVEDNTLLEETKNKLLNTQIQLKQNNSILNEFLKQTELKEDRTRLLINLNNAKDLDIAEPLNKIIKASNQKTTKKISDLVEKYDTNRRIKIDYLNQKPFRYSKTLNKVLVNPNHPDFEDYNIKESIIHEIAHMVDINNKFSSNPKIADKINKLQKIIIKNKDDLNSLLESSKYADNIFVSDLFAGITKNEVRGFWGHPDGYWNNSNDRYSEILSNIETIYLKNDKAAMEIINKIPEFKKFFESVVKEYDKFI